MNTKLLKSLYWTPRVLSIAFAAFLIIFSFDVFEEAHSPKDIAIGLLMHNLPSIFMFLMIWAMWKREWIGAVIFPLLSALYIFWAWGRFPLSVYFLIAGPPIVLGVLYFFNWRLRNQLRPANV